MVRKYLGEKRSFRDYNSEINRCGQQQSKKSCQIQALWVPEVKDFMHYNFKILSLSTLLSKNHEE
jgi:hypothetical protein